jgi:hypothetical protein
MCPLHCSKRILSSTFFFTEDNEIDVAIGSPLTIIMRKVKEISTQLANQLKKSLIELPNSSVSLSTIRPLTGSVEGLAASIVCNY